MNFHEYDALLDSIRESNIPILVELRDWALLPDSFKDQIQKKYEILFSNIPSEVASFDE
jgi:hypothetical protein